jgi:competence protein ComGB
MKYKNSKWKFKEQGQFLLHIGQLLEQGYTLGKAIELVGIHQRRDVRDKVNEIVSLLREGNPVHQILLEYHFPKKVAGFLFFAEQHGNLSFAFQESGKLMVKQIELGNEFIKLIRYPIFLCIVTFIVFIFILRRLIPQFQNLYHSLDIELPLITIIFINLIDTAPIVLFFLLIFTVFLSYIFFKKVKRYNPLEKMKLYANFPIVKSILSIFNTHYFAIQLSYLLKGGLSIFECLTLFEKQSYFMFFQLEAIEMKERLKEGISFPELLEGNPLFTPELGTVVSHGLSNGQLSKDLAEYCSFLVITFEEKFKFYFSIIQPVLFSLIGVIIFVMFISILLPMFNLLNSL